jgi:hypothetical protein
MAFTRITPTRFGASELDVSPTLTTIRTTPSFARDLLKSMDIANNAAVAAQVSVYLVPSGDAASADNLLVPEVAIPAHGIFQWTGTQVLDPGATIQASASIAGVTLTASGGEAI